LSKHSLKHQNSHQLNKMQSRIGCLLNLNPKDDGISYSLILKMYYPNWLLKLLPNIVVVKLKT